MVDDLTASLLVSALRGTRFTAVDVVESTTSTQTVLAADRGPAGRVLVADHQISGRGRLDRAWVSPPGRSLLFSAAIGPVPYAAPLVTLAGGVAVWHAVRAIHRGDVTLKWPNDVMIGTSKVAGVLGEVAGDVVILGIGVNVAQRSDELPEGVDATSLELVAGRSVSRSVVLAGILWKLDELLSSGASAWLDEYRSNCATIGRRVVVRTAGGDLTGVAQAVRDDGVLLVDGTPVSAGDVTHVRTP